MQEQLSYQAMHDPLTGLANRMLFLDRVEHALAQRPRSGTTNALLYVDLDRFQCVNDSLGHAAGDQLLAVASERLKAVVRRGDTVARLGGDEFTVLCESISESDASALARRVEESFERPVRLEGEDVRVGVSIGVAMSHREGEQAVDLLRAADTAMYESMRSAEAGWRLDRSASISAVVHGAEPPSPHL